MVLKLNFGKQTCFVNFWQVKQTPDSTDKQYRNEDSLQTENAELLETSGFNQIDEQEKNYGANFKVYAQDNKQTFSIRVRK